MFFRDITKISTSGLRGMQQSIHDRLVEEDAGIADAYGVRRFPDWRQQADEIEAELDKRGEIYSKVPW